MKIIVDTNLVFSALLNSGSKIGKLILNGGKNMELFSCSFLKIELEKHHDKLIKLSKLSPSKLSEVKEILTHKITFVDERLLPSQLLLKTEKLLISIDTKDTPFVALAIYLKAKLWTGDMKLYRGLKAKNFEDVLTFAELSQIIDDLENG
ncbi:MAG: PIN domain-containing protein [Mucilaginibacter sp.]|uniref:PIN domain-containing protein n=1 Tax=Mucilaginibacter sp. TaxID=1882438 RepID=UPI0034E5374F